MSSTQHSEEAWAVVTSLFDYEPWFCRDWRGGDGDLPRLFRTKREAQEYLRDCSTKAKHRIVRVRISTIGAKGRKGKR